MNIVPIKLSQCSMERNEWMNTAPRVLILFLVVASLMSCVSNDIEKPPPGQEDISVITDYGHRLIQHLIVEHDVPGISVALVNRGGIVWTQGYGWASKIDAEPLTADSVMRAASITKILTAVSIMQLVEKGKVDLDSSLTTYLPEFSILSRFPKSNFTIRQMLTHHSGLPSDLMRGFKLYNGDAAPDNLLDQFRRLPLEANSLHLASEPGKSFSYSNLAFALLGLVIERVTGEPYPKYIENQILSPLGMEDSAIVYPGHGDLLNQANGFGEEGEISDRYIRDISAGGLAASARDMGKFLQLFLRDSSSILSKDSVKMMLTAQNDDVDLDGDLRFGLSLFISEQGHMPFYVSHGGDSHPYHAYLRILPEEGWGIIVMSNSDNGQFVVQQVASEIMEVAYQSKSANRRDVINVKKPHPKRIQISDEHAKSFEGINFAGPDIGMVKIKENHGDLTMTFSNESLATAKLVPLENGNFDFKLHIFGFIPVPIGLGFLGVEEPHFELEFEKIEGKQFLWLTADGIRGLFPVATLVEKKVVPNVWADRIGTYYNREGQDSILQSVKLSFDERSGFLQARIVNDIQPPKNMPLKILSSNKATILGIGRFSGEIIEAEPNNSIMYAGVRFERVNF